MDGSTFKFDAIQPVILCGGSGTRLWPVSREAFPKQFLNLASDRSMFQETCMMLSGRPEYARPMILTNEKFRFIALRQMRELDLPVGRVILEPHGRNTAPAIALAALAAADQDRDAVLLVLPSDHVIGDNDSFHAAVEKAAQLARSGFLVTFGIHPAGPETGYGYIRKGHELEPGCGAFRVEKFVEKPDVESARGYIDDGGYLWNSGMFVFTARRYLEELRKFNHAILATCNAALAAGEYDGNLIKPDGRLFEPVENISIDYAVIEHTKSAVVVAAEFGWSDVGTWPRVAELGDRDGDNNVVDGDAILSDCKDCYVRSENRLVVALGLSDQIIIETDDAVLVADKDHAQQIKDVVAKLKSAKRGEAENRKKVERPWGSFESVHRGARHQVKHIVVQPGEKLSLQYHHHRAEHWIVVSGMAEVTLNDSVKMIAENESVYIPVGSRHRVFNPGPEPLHFIEVQYGDYLGEDDIVRLEDDYGRVAADAGIVTTDEVQRRRDQVVEAAAP